MWLLHFHLACWWQLTERTTRRKEPHVGAQALSQGRVSSLDSISKKRVLWRSPPTNPGWYSGQKIKKRGGGEDYNKIIWKASCMFLKNQCRALKDGRVRKMKLLRSMPALFSRRSHSRHTGREGIYEEVAAFSTRGLLRKQMESRIKMSKKKENAADFACVTSADALHWERHTQ